MCGRNRDGLEDCAVLTDQKGWLPSATLRLAGADPGVDVGQLRYLVQRGADANNLTVRTDAWRPLQYDEDGQTFFAMRAGGYPNDILTLTDFCPALGDGTYHAAERDPCSGQCGARTRSGVRAGPPRQQ